jgi:acyl carrier protein
VTVEEISRGPKLFDVEKSLVSIWGHALRLPTEQIDRESSFFALGGDSLSAMLCITRIRSMYSLQFDLVDFFLDTSTVSEFSQRIFASMNGDPNVNSA